MSHFTVTVCLDGTDDRLSRITHVTRDGFPLRDLIQDYLGQILAPFDENREVDPYRRYEEGSPEDYWLYSSLRRAATEKPPYETDPAANQTLEHLMAKDPDGTRREPGEKDRQRQADTELFRSLPDPVTWADIARVHNDRYGADDGLLLIDDATGRAYTMSTYNPRSKWDWFAIGGRWPGRFPYREESAGQVIPAQPHWGAKDEPIPPLHCDGGPLRALDLGKMRDETAAKARETHARYRALTEGTPEALPWSVFTENVSAGNGYTIGRAREEYNSQPRIRVLRDSREFSWRDNEDFQMPEEAYIERARQAAVPGWATLTTDGCWMAPGEMGWFGMSTDSESSRAGYQEAANAYISALPGSTWLISVDCHIL